MEPLPVTAESLPTVDPPTSTAQVLDKTAADADWDVVNRRMSGRPQPEPVAMRAVRHLPEAVVDERADVRRQWRAWGVSSVRSKGVLPFQWGSLPPPEEVKSHASAPTRQVAEIDKPDLAVPLSRSLPRPSTLEASLRSRRSREGGSTVRSHHPVPPLKLDLGATHSRDGTQSRAGSMTSTKLNKVRGFTATEILALERERRGPTPRRSADVDVDSFNPPSMLRRGQGALPAALVSTMMYQ
jgi:hypothetical protein